MTRSEKWPELDAAAKAVVDKFLAAPAVRRSQPPKYEGKERRTRLTTEGVKPVAHLEDAPSFDEHLDAGMNLRSKCRFEEPCEAMAWRSGLCRRHYNTISARKAKARKAERRF